MNTFRFLAPWVSRLGAVALALLLATGRLLAQSASNPVLPPDSGSDSPIQLTPFSVTEAHEVGYGALSNSASGRLNQSYLDIAQTASIVTSEFLADANLNSAMDAMNFVPNVQVQGSSHTGATYTIRGESVGDPTIDGFVVADAANFDTYFADRIEIVKGPTDPSFGTSGPGGFINFVSKLPTFADSTALGFGVASGDRIGTRFTLDQNGLLSADRQTAYRVVAVYDRGAGSGQLSEFERAGALISIIHNLKDRGKITVIQNYSQDKDPSTVNNPSFENRYEQQSWLQNSGNTLTNVPLLPQDVTLGYNTDKFIQLFETLSVILEYKLTEHWSMRQAFNYHDWDKEGTLGIGNAGSIQLTNGVYTVSIPQQRWQYHNQGFQYQGDYFAEYTSPFLESHFRILAGYDYNNGQDIPQNTQSPTVAAPRQPLLNFNQTDPNLLFPEYSTTGVVNSGQAYGVFLEPQANFFNDRLQITGALRKQYSRNTSLNRVTNQYTWSTSNYRLIPRLSVLYKLVPWLSAYGLYTQNVSPVSVIPEYSLLPYGDPRMADTLTVSPTTTQREVGLKGAVMKNTLIFTVSAFEVNIAGGALSNFTNETINGSATTIGTNFEASTKVRGYEAEVFGQITKDLTLIAGLGYTNGLSQIGAATFAKESSAPTTASIYLKYDFLKRGNSAFAAIFGAKEIFSGWNMQTTFTAEYPNNQYEFDGGVSYRFAIGRRHYKAELKVDNIANAAIVEPPNTRLYGRLAYLKLETNF